MRIFKGRILNVVADISRGLLNFDGWINPKLSAGKWNQMFLPEGLGHGYLTPEPDTEVINQVADTYPQAHERSILFDDMDIGIDWELAGSKRIPREGDPSATPRGCGTVS